MEPLLRTILETRRSDGSMSEAKFVAWYVQQAFATGAELEFIDTSGNVAFKIGESTTLFVAHADTVSRDYGQNELVFHEDGTVTAKNSTLGADDGVGIFMLLTLMDHGKPGTYLLTRGEECGGVGSTELVRNHGDWLSRFKRSICIDRRGTGEVIYRQGMSDTASFEFAEELANLLSDTGTLLYAPSELGVFTDNALYTSHISENVNLSAGYWNEHGDKEVLLERHVYDLAAALLHIDFDAIEARRPLTESRRFGSMFTRAEPKRERGDEDWWNEFYDTTEAIEVLNDSLSAKNTVASADAIKNEIELELNNLFSLLMEERTPAFYDRTLLTCQAALDCMNETHPDNFLMNKIRCPSIFNQVGKPKVDTADAEVKH